MADSAGAEGAGGEGYEDLEFYYESPVGDPAHHTTLSSSDDKPLADDDLYSRSQHPYEPARDSALRRAGAPLTEEVTPVASLYTVRTSTRTVTPGNVDTLRTPLPIAPDTAGGHSAERGNIASQPQQHGIQATGSITAAVTSFTEHPSSSAGQPDDNKLASEQTGSAAGAAHRPAVTQPATPDEALAEQPPPEGDSAAQRRASEEAARAAAAARAAGKARVSFTPGGVPDVSALRAREAQTAEARRQREQELQLEAEARRQREQELQQEAARQEVERVCKATLDQIDYWLRDVAEDLSLRAAHAGFDPVEVIQGVASVQQWITDDSPHADPITIAHEVKLLGTQFMRVSRQPNFDVATASVPDMMQRVYTARKAFVQREAFKARVTAEEHRRAQHEGSRRRQRTEPPTSAVDPSARMSVLGDLGSGGIARRAQPN